MIKNIFKNSIGCEKGDQKKHRKSNLQHFFADLSALKADELTEGFGVSSKSTLDHPVSYGEVKSVLRNTLYLLQKRRIRRLERQFFRIDTFAVLAVLVSPSCAQQALTSLRALKTPRPYYDTWNPNSWWHGNEDKG